MDQIDQEIKAGNKDIKVDAGLAKKLALRQGVRIEENHGGMFRPIREPLTEKEMFQYRHNFTRSNLDLPKISNLKEHVALFESNQNAEKERDRR